MKKIYFVFIVVIVGFMSSCTYNEYVPEELPPVDTSKVYSFALDVQPIFSAKCTGCHGTAAGLSLEEGNAYDNIVPARINADVPEESLIYTKPLPTGTHSAKYSAEEAQNVLLWIEQGAKNN